MVVLCVSIVMLRASAPARVIPPPPPRTAPPAPAVQPAVDDAPSDEATRAVRGTCDLGLVPPSMVQALTDAESDELVTLVNEWIASEDSFGPRPSIEYRRGIVYVESEEARADDPPYPRSASAEAERMCGSAATWLRSYLRERLFAVGDISCTGNVCCYSGVEYSPTGLVVFHHDSGWVLEAWAQADVAALAPSIADANLEYVKKQLARLAPKHCGGEPAGRD